MLNQVELTIIERIKEIIRKETTLTESEGTFKGSIYLERGEELHEHNIKNILNSSDKLGTFYDELFDWCLESTDYEYDFVYKTLKDNWESGIEIDFYEYEDFINEWVRENVIFDFPYDELLLQELNVNIMIDNGDGNYDFTLNNFLSYNASEDEEIEDESGIVWLVNQQGYSKNDLEKAIEEGTDSKFLNSIISECQNVSSHMNALNFFVKMTLKDIIDIENKKELILSKDTNAGLLDIWNGAGGLLEIYLEKNVTVPLKIASLDLDGNRGYGVGSIYGMSNNFWANTITSVK